MSERVPQSPSEVVELMENIAMRYGDNHPYYDKPPEILDGRISIYLHDGSLNSVRTPRRMELELPLANAVMAVLAMRALEAVITKDNAKSREQAANDDAEGVKAGVKQNQYATLEEYIADLSRVSTLESEAAAARTAAEGVAESCTRALFILARVLPPDVTWKFRLERDVPGINSGRQSTLSVKLARSGYWFEVEFADNELSPDHFEGHW